jgi:hypothetical protein
MTPIRKDGVCRGNFVKFYSLIPAKEIL